MIEKIEETALIVRIEHENPIDSRALGCVLCAFSKEFDLFLMSSADYGKYKNKNLTLGIRKIEHGSIEMSFGIICNINIDIDILSNINNDVLPLFFNHLKESYQKLNELAKFILRFKAKINFEKVISGKKTNDSFSIDNKDAEETLDSHLKSELNALKNELSLVKEKQKTLSESFDTIINELCDNNDSNNLESKLDALRDELSLVKIKQDILKETLNVIADVYRNNEPIYLISELNTLRGDLSSAKIKQDTLNGALCTITDAFRDKNNSTKSKEVSE